VYIAYLSGEHGGCVPLLDKWIKAHKNRALNDFFGVLVRILCRQTLSIGSVRTSQRVLAISLLFCTALRFQKSLSPALGTGDKAESLQCLFSYDDCVLRALFVSVSGSAFPKFTL
jgi:hypothetical protein